MKRVDVFSELKFLFLFLLFPFLSIGQTAESNIQNEIKYPQFKVQGLFQGRYLSGFTHGVDATTGLQHSDGNGVEDTFDIKRRKFRGRKY
ncbi:hypothetical protein AB9T88_14605 [Flavobacterium sp. LBUM151]